MNKLASYVRSLFRAALPRRRSRESFERMFNGFREVLDRNNQSLEIITDMGDTLGGDYLFDIQYVRRSYAALFTAIEGSLASFDQLTLNRYPRLRDVFLTIDGQIRRVIEESAPASDALLLFYENIKGDQVRAVGGKNNSLAAIRNSLNINVPEAFAVTTRAFDTFLSHNRIIEIINPNEDGIAVSEAALSKARELVLQGTIPPELDRAIEKAVKKLKSRVKENCTLAVRSSAGEEDGEFSFAGQFETVLNVPLEAVAVEKAYRQVVASLFTEKAAAYQARVGLDFRTMKMAVACVAMVDATASGVIYSASPDIDRNSMTINATWGLGTSIVEGQTDADFYRVSRTEPFDAIETRVGAKDSMVVPVDSGTGIATVATPEGKRKGASLTPSQILALARQALAIEKHFGSPQDIEWAIDKKGELFILQSRPLRIPEDPAHCATMVPDVPESRVLAQQFGRVVQKGVAAGRVFLFKSERELDLIPRGAVLVAHRDSSSFVRVMTEVAAIITDVGTPTSHMATLCREFKIPTIVNAGNAMQLLSSGQEITVQVNSEGATLYEGMVRQLVECAQDEAMMLNDLFEFRKKRYLLRYIAPLNLVDPLKDEFTPRACKTMHDILRFIHEKAVAELIEGAERVKAGAVNLDLPIPAGIMLIDIGGGLNNPEGKVRVGPEQVTSLPLQAIITGMTHPGAWRSDAVPLKVNDFMASMLRVPDITTDAGRVEQNMAVISREYANINLKFGYHYIILDCYCSENTRNNHIYFRFAGGATDISKRSRRLQLIGSILGEYGFNIKTKGDLIVARLANIQQAEAEKLLDQIGRLFSYTRQLDAVLNDDHAIERYTRSFLQGNYEQAGSAVSEQ